MHARDADRHWQDRDAPVIRHVVPAVLRGDGAARAQAGVLHPHRARDGEGSQRVEVLKRLKNKFSSL